MCAWNLCGMFPVFDQTKATRTKLSTENGPQGSAYFHPPWGPSVRMEQVPVLSTGHSQASRRARLGALNSPWTWRVAHSKVNGNHVCQWACFWCFMKLSMAVHAPISVYSLLTCFQVCYYYLVYAFCRYDVRIARNMMCKYFLYITILINRFYRLGILFLSLTSKNPRSRICASCWWYDFVNFQILNHIAQTRLLHWNPISVCTRLCPYIGSLSDIKIGTYPI